MKNIEDTGSQYVYTRPGLNVDNLDLLNADKTPTHIKEAYFSQTSEDGSVRRVPFNRMAVNREESVLTIEILGDSLSISGLEEIMEFMMDTGSFGNGLNSLKGRGVTKYELESQVIGIGVDYSQDNSK